MSPAARTPRAASQRYQIADRIATLDVRAALRDALTGAAHKGEPDVIWEDRGSQILLHVGQLQVHTLDNVLVVAVDTETAEFGETSLIVRFVFGNGRDPATLVASSDDAVHGHPLVAARWGGLYRSVIWTAVVRLSEAHADERGLRPTGIVIGKDQLRLSADPPVSLPDLAIAHLDRLATELKPIGDTPGTLIAAVTKPKPSSTPKPKRRPR